MRAIVELPPRRETEAAVPPGHTQWTQECLACRRDFRVYVPARPILVGTLTLDVPCPHCHRHKAEVLIGAATGPVLVEASERSWLEWRMRRARQIFDVARRTVVVRAGQVGRAIRRLVPDRR
jgi:hypothetical protein